MIRKHEKDCVQFVITGIETIGKEGSKYSSKAGGLQSSDTNASTCDVILFLCIDSIYTFVNMSLKCSRFFLSPLPTKPTVFMKSFLGTHFLGCGAGVVAEGAALQGWRRGVSTLKEYLRLMRSSGPTGEIT